MGEWIKCSVRPWTEDLLDPNKRYFNPDIVQRRWRDYLAGRRDSTAAIWTILMFQSWLETNSGLNAVPELSPALAG